MVIRQLQIVSRLYCTYKWECFGLFSNNVVHRFLSITVFSLKRVHQKIITILMN